jgi:hypothetical protein
VKRMAPAAGFKGLQARISNHFEEKGFSGAQIAKAILVHEILGICLLGTVLDCFFSSMLLPE